MNDDRIIAAQSQQKFHKLPYGTKVTGPVSAAINAYIYKTISAERPQN